MAALVYFRKISEDAETVRYAFGPDPEDLPRTLTLNKASRTSTVDDGRLDHLSLKASRKINALHSRSTHWPDRGMSAS
ncbi:hypothetical protein ACIA98_36720 [Streptomyces sp. NPDC051366]|uniref:hypothetical protein n=1 Tax=Streptomyces sp. NPDC051366 TaxID=3365652 RepID=UPI0037A965F0